MRFGILVNADEVPGVAPRQRLAEHIDRAVTAAGLGFGTMAFAHRYSYGPAVEDARGKPLETSRFQPLLLMAHIARELGDAVQYATSTLVSPGLHPVQFAEDIATLDAMCQGRLRIGVGLGWAPYEFEAFGVSMKTRARRFEELLTVTRGLLSGEVVDFHGDFFDADNVRMIAHSEQKPFPPFWVGGNVEAAVRRAARLGEAWVMSAHTPIEELKQFYDVYREVRTEAGLPMPVQQPISRQMFVAKDRETALAKAEVELAEWYRKRGEWGWFLTKSKKTHEEIIEAGRWIIGSPQDCIDQVEQLRDELGVTDVLLGMTWASITNDERLASQRLFAEEVIPHFSKAPASIAGGSA